MPWAFFVVLSFTTTPIKVSYVRGGLLLCAMRLALMCIFESMFRLLLKVLSLSLESTFIDA